MIKCQYCNKYKALENETFCEFHLNLKLLNDEDIEKGHRCIRCPRMIFIDNKRCDFCIEASKKQRKPSKEILCIFNNCIFKKKNGDYCVNHEYLKDYTEEMLNNLKICSGCKRQVYISDKHKTCDKCVLRSNTNKAKKQDELVVKCKECNYKARENSEYCGVHQKKQLLKEAKEKLQKENEENDKKDPDQTENYKT